MSQTNESCTRFAKLLGIEVPFLNAPMEGIATPELVAAVSEAGGLGVIPAAGLAPDEIRAFAARVKELTQKPFAVNLAVPVDAPADAAERFERFCILSAHEKIITPVQLIHFNNTDDHGDQ